MKLLENFIKYRKSALPRGAVHSCQCLSPRTSALVLMRWKFGFSVSRISSLSYVPVCAENYWNSSAESLFSFLKNPPKLTFIWVKVNMKQKDSDLHFNSQGRAEDTFGKMHCVWLKGFHSKTAAFWPTWAEFWQKGLNEWQSGAKRDRF